MDNISFSLEPDRGLLGFVKSLFYRQKDNYKLAEEKELEALMDAVKNVKLDLESAERLFNNTSDPDLIESAIYQQYAARLKFSYLVKRAKEQNLKCANLISL